MQSVQKFDFIIFISVLQSAMSKEIDVVDERAMDVKKVKQKKKKKVTTLRECSHELLTTIFRFIILRVLRIVVYSVFIVRKIFVLFSILGYVFVYLLCYVTSRYGGSIDEKYCRGNVIYYQEFADKNHWIVSHIKYSCLNALTLGRVLFVR